MKIVFNDATEMSVQSVTEKDGQLLIKAAAVVLDDLRAKFSDKLSTKKIEVVERGQTIAVYEDYTTLYRLEEYTGKIFGVVMYQEQKTPEVQKEVQAAAIAVAQIQAQALTDAQALAVKVLYKNWEDDPEGYAYKTDNQSDLRRNYNGHLWKLQKDHAKQADWYPGVDPTLWTEIVEGHAGTLADPIPVPDSVMTSGFEYECGKYYSENGTVYIMNRMGMAEGDTLILYFPPSQLVGTYFGVVEGE